MGRCNVYSTALIALLKEPGSVAGIAEAHWQSIVEAGRKNQMLGQLAALLQRRSCLGAVPPNVRRHLDLAALTSVRRAEAAKWEVQRIRQAVEADIPVILLKGAAYAASGDYNAEGRLFSDIDVLVPRSQLQSMESALFGAGWKPKRLNQYDASYYRNWMHEVPPMEHVRRHTVVDLHHAINPPVSRVYVDPEQLLSRIVEIEPGLFVLSAADRVVHCCLHLLQEGEPKKVLRELYDLHILVEQHFDGPAGLRTLLSRADELAVTGQVRVAVAAANCLFNGDPSAIGYLGASLVRSACEANGVSQSMLAKMAGTHLLAYSHWLKMPMHILVPHLARKSWLRLWPESGGKA